MKGAGVFVGNFELHSKRKRPIWEWPKHFLTPKKDHFKTQIIIFFYTSSRAALNETFPAKYKAFSPEHPKWYQNPKFTSVSETTVIPASFIWEPPPPAQFSSKSKPGTNFFFNPFVWSFLAVPIANARCVWLLLAFWHETCPRVFLSFPRVLGKQTNRIFIFQLSVAHKRLCISRSLWTELNNSGVQEIR